MRRWTCTLTLIPAVALILLVGCSTPGDDDDDTQACSGPAAGEPSVGANGWPEGYTPKGFQGTGQGLGEVAEDFMALDQHGHADVQLSQFYGSMILLDFSALWCAPCNAAAATAQELFEEINHENDLFHFWYIHMLVDDAEFGADSNGGWATEDHADGWATDYGIEFPVLAGQGAWEQQALWGATALPRLFVLDPELRVRADLSGYGGDGALHNAVRAGFEDFCEENPGWESPF
jgi:thiol-disulfide isomerase/thioredoxin